MLIDVIILVLFFIMVFKLFMYYMDGNEGFNKDMTEFPELGEKRYDMRGRLLNSRPMCDCLCNQYGTCYAGNEY